MAEAASSACTILSFCTRKSIVSQKGVSTPPKNKLVMRISVLFTSSRTLCIIPTNPYLLAQYAAAPAIGTLPNTPGIFMISPFFSAFIDSRKAFNNKKGATKLACKLALKSCSLKLSKGLMMPVPAAFIRMSMVEKASKYLAFNAATSSAEVTSATMVCAAPILQACATAANFSALLPVIKTLAPLSLSNFALLDPIPPVAPTSSIFLPLTFSIIFSFFKQ